MRVRETDYTLWARLQDGEITYGPGLRPYRLGGDIIDSWTDEELFAIDFQNVVVDYDDQFDPDIQDKDTPIDTVEDGQVVRTLVYAFQPSPRNKMQAKVDEYFARVTKLSPYLLAEYLDAEVEANRALETGASTDPADYPMLEADIGVTRDNDGNVVSTPAEAAVVVQMEAGALRAQMASIRTSRLAVKADIREHSTTELAFAAYRSVVPPGA